MNLSIDHNRLYALLEQAPLCEPPNLIGYQGEVNDYLLEHFLMPFLRGGQPLVRDIDFSQFTTEDVQDFGKYIESVSATGGKLMHMAQLLSATSPLSLVGQRAFC